MKNIILIAGYTKSTNLDIIRDLFWNEDIVLGCAYSREPKTETKQKYLTKFDVLYNLQQPSDIEKLQHSAENVLLVTCTQERDMEAYIETLALCGKITDMQQKTYTNALNKRAMKESLSEKNPELIPQVREVNAKLLSSLDTLSYPQVIKPSGLAGSILISIVNSPEEFRQHYDQFAERMREIGSEFYEKNIEVISEEFISGPQYSVNVYIDANQNITFCPISRVVTPQELGSNDSYSAMQYITDELSKSEFMDLKSAVRTAVEHFDIRDTSAHFDSVLCGGQWKFFEIGLRTGGYRQEMYQLSHGMNHFRNDILNRLGKNIQIPEQKNTACIVQKAAEQKGILKKITYERNIIKEKTPLIREGKMAKINSEVMPLSEGGGTITRFFVHGKDQVEVIEESKKLFHSIKFEIN